eukprot:6209153-Pleurochrysis_carterae.AAC.1
MQDHGDSKTHFAQIPPVGISSTFCNHMADTTLTVNTDGKYRIDFWQKVIARRVTTSELFAELVNRT